MCEDSTVAQREYLISLHKKLGWSLNGIKEATKQQASAMITRAKRELSRPVQDRSIYRQREQENELGNDPERW